MTSDAFRKSGKPNSGCHKSHNIKQICVSVQMLISNKCLAAPHADVWL